MRFWTDDDNLTIGLTLDFEAADLTADRLGDEILDYAQAGFSASAQAERAPSGQRWAPLKPATIAAKGDSRVGYRTGQMIGNLSGGTRQVSPTSCTWSYPRDDTWGRAHGFHNGQARTKSPARPLVGWTPDAQEHARNLVNWASRPSEP